MAFSLLILHLLFLSVSFSLTCSLYIFTLKVFILKYSLKLSPQLFSCSSNCCSRIVLCICLGFILAHIRLLCTRCTLSAATVAFCDFSALLLFLCLFPCSSVSVSYPFLPTCTLSCAFRIAFKLIAVNHICHLPLLRIRPVTLSLSLSVFPSHFFSCSASFIQFQLRCLS